MSEVYPIIEDRLAANRKELAKRQATFLDQYRKQVYRLCSQWMVDHVPDSSPEWKQINGCYLTFVETHHPEAWHEIGHKLEDELNVPWNRRLFK